MSWIECKEQMPEDKKDVLFWACESNVEIGFYNKFHDEWFANHDDYGYKRKSVTHWMHLPEPPLTRLFTQTINQ